MDGADLEPAQWLTFNKGYLGYRYSKLSQINAQNVPNLKPVCSFNLGEQGSFQNGPIVYDGVLYTTSASAFGLINAIDPASGQLKWRYRVPSPPVGGLTATAGGLVITGETNGDLVVLDAKTGALLHQVSLGAGAIHGGVVTYAANGRQFIAVAAGDTNATYKAKGDNMIVILGVP